MKIAKNTPISRILAVSLLLIALDALYLLLVMPLLHHYQENREEIDYLRRQIASYERIAGSRAELEKAFSSIREEQDAVGYYLKGGTKALASAELQTYVRVIIEASKGNLVSTQPIVRGGERESERMVRVNVRMTGTIETLVNVFYRIANGVPVLLTDSVLIRRNKSSQPAAGEGDEGDLLDIQFTLTGFVEESVL